MLPNFRTSFVLSLSVLLAACGGGKDPDADVMGDPAAQAGTAAPAAGAAPAQPAAPAAPQVVMPVEVSNDAITLGTSTNGGRVVKAPRASFTMSDTVYAGVGGGHPPGTDARVYWTNQKNGMSDKEETKKTTDEGVVFAFDKASGMKPGRYSVQVDVGAKPIGIVDFEVK